MSSSSVVAAQLRCRYQSTAKEHTASQEDTPQRKDKVYYNVGVGGMWVGGGPVRFLFQFITFAVIPWWFACCDPPCVIARGSHFWKRVKIKINFIAFCINLRKITINSFLDQNSTKIKTTNFKFTCRRSKNENKPGLLGSNQKEVRRRWRWANPAKCRWQTVSVWLLMDEECHTVRRILQDG